MANITIRNLPDKTKQTLRVNAAILGLSLEAYARTILENASQHNQQPVNILDIADKYFGSQHGINIELSARNSNRSINFKE